MDFLKKLMQETAPITYADFWAWFKKEERTFFKVIKERRDIEKAFFKVLSEKLDQIKEGIFYLTGMADEGTVELIFTPDGVVENVVFVEELVAAAPTIKGWKFTALKPALAIENVGIQMQTYEFNGDNLFFYALEDSNYPDEIDLRVIHNNFKQENEQIITNGTFLFLDNFLGELNLITTIDELMVIGKEAIEKELIPIAKLKSYLNWRQKEFLEKYEGVRYQTAEDDHAILTAALKDGSKVIAVLNTELLKWENKASHPWVTMIDIKFEGVEKGMPSKATQADLDKIESELLTQLKDIEGYLNIGRQTSRNLREIYFACKDFRKPSKVLYEMQLKYMERYELDFEIYKDKYWRTFDRYGIQ
ncbi:MAG: DUF695 domain-containing protein [Saprospiraceae bacterium]